MQPYEVRLGVSAQRVIKKLRKTYPNIEQDLEEAWSFLKSNPKRGEPAKGSPYLEIPLRKIKMPCSDLRRGRRQGYRIFYMTVGQRVFVLFIFLREEGYPNQKSIEEALKEFF